MPIIIGALKTIPNFFNKRAGSVVNWRLSRNHPNNRIVEIVQNTEKKSGGLRGLAVIQTSLKTNQLTLE